MQLRSQIKQTLSDPHLRFSYMPLMVKAISLALKEYPLLNAHVDTDCTQVTYRADHNIGVAVDTPLGLVVPNVKQVQVGVVGNYQWLINSLFIRAKLF